VQHILNQRLNHRRNWRVRYKEDKCLRRVPSD
jgi:hypothetical protein